MKVIDFEKLLPADLPPGEKVLWHGRPNWPSLARRAFRADIVVAYFIVMAGWNFATALEDGGLSAAILSAVKTLGAGAIAIALICLLAWLSARTTLYVVTTRRVVMKVGIALPIFFNLPFAEIVAAARHAYGDGTGDLPLSLSGGQRIAYLHLWPHARPFQFTSPQPCLRCVPDVEQVGDILGRALVAAAGAPAYAPAPVATPASVGATARALDKRPLATA